MPRTALALTEPVFPLGAEHMKRVDAADEVAGTAGGEGDPGRAALREAQARYLHQHEELEAMRAELLRLERDVAVARAEKRRLEQRLVATEARMARERARRRADRERNERLTTARHRLHHELYGGATTQVLLQAALQITTATRGCYVSTPDMRVRAVAGVDAAIGDAPPPFIAAVCERVVAEGRAVHWNSALPLRGYEATTAAQCREGIGVAVAVRGMPHGVIVALDKAVGEFQPYDVHALLLIGSDGAIAIENAELRDQVQQAFVTTIELLADTIEASDPYTRGHCAKVVRYARETARRLGVGDDALRTTCYAALLHDIGKIGVSDGLLNKPGPLLDEERALMQAHVRIGHDLLRTIPALDGVADAVLRHHEWYDGNGYPDGWEGDRIPLPSRIVAVADAYCAMLDRRAYKEAFSPSEARRELHRCAGSQFDPQVVAAMLDAIEVVDAGRDDQEDHCGLPPGVVRPEPLPPDA